MKRQKFEWRVVDGQWVQVEVPHRRRRRAKLPKPLWREYAESIALAVVLALILRAFVIQAFKIPTGSMRPTLMEEDRILVNKIAYGPRIPGTPWRLPALAEPQRGDIIVFRSPEDPHRDFVKRLAALEGELIEIKGGKLWINGRVVTWPVVFQQLVYYSRGDYATPGLPVRVPQDHYFVLGDNSGSSRDSRYWGFLPKTHLVGKALVIYWPLKRIRAVR